MKYLTLLFLLISTLHASCQNHTALYQMGDLTRGSTDSFVYAVIGDFGIDTKDEKAVADMVINDWKPSFIVTTGDNDYEDKFPAGSGKTIDTFITKYYGAYMNPTLSKNRFFPVMGNHDQQKAGVEDSYMGLFPYLQGMENYQFTWGPIHFYALNSGPEGVCAINDTMLANVQQKLDADTARGEYRIVMYHHPSYSSVAGTVVGNCYVEGKGIDITLNGHIHYYERLRDSIHHNTYITIGNSGRNDTECPNTIQDKLRHNKNVYSQSCHGNQNGAVKVTVIRSTNTGTPHWRMTFEYYNVAQPSGPLDVVTIRK
jgi:hypothetical protein